MNARRRKLLRLQKELKRKQAGKDSFFKKVSNFFVLLFILAGLAVVGLQHYGGIDLREVEYLGNVIDLLENNTTQQANESTQSTGTAPHSKDFFLPAHDTNDPMLIQHQYYTLHYNEEHEQANWVAYKLTADHLKGDAKRPNDFRPDAKIATGSATPADYRNSGYDRGHLAPSGDFKFSERAMSETFFMSNMSPQRNEFNGGIWHDLEREVRNWAVQKKTIYIITGPILEKGLSKIGINQVSVPKRYFKIIINDDLQHLQAIAFVMANRKSYLSPENYAVSIDEIEALTGIDFFPALEDDIETELERQIQTSPWYE